MKRRVIIMLATVLGAWGLWAQNPPAAAPAAPPAPVEVTVRLVAADAPERLVSDFESLVPITETVEGQGKGGKPQLVTVGEKATLWVRAAAIDGKFTFERYYQGKYINRSPELTLTVKDLGVGKHVLEPGAHEFSVAADGTLTAADPDVAIAGKTLSLKLYPVDVMAVRAGGSGPPEQRLVPESFGLYLTRPDTVVSKEQVPVLDDPKTGLPNLLSHAREFYPLRVWLPANTQGLGYLLYPCFQTFHVQPGGVVRLSGVAVPGVTVSGTRLELGYHEFRGQVNTATNLGAGVGGTPVKDRFTVRPTLQDVLFTAGFGTPSRSFGLPIPNDFGKLPNKFLTADNLAADPKAVRLLAVEWDQPVLTRGATATLGVRFVENHLELWAEDVADWALILPRLQAHKEMTGPHPLSALRRYVQRVDPKLLTAWDQMKEPKFTANDEAAVLAALNLALHDRAFYVAEGWAGITLSPATKALADAGLAQLPLNDLLRAQRGLLGDLLPKAFRELTRQPTIPQPTIRAAWSPYFANSPSRRQWTASAPAPWKDGQLALPVPDLPYGFYVLRLLVMDAADPATATALGAELQVCIINPGQTGTAAIASAKGRNAFVCGEDVRLEVIFRSAAARPAGRPTVVLTRADGVTERLTAADPGGTWASQPLLLPGAVTAQLLPGHYELSFADLPAGMAPWPFGFDLVARERPSPYLIIKASKYTGPMNGLVTSWLGGYQGGTAPIDLDRAVATLAELGYNRLDLMTYVTDNHQRPFAVREDLAATDARLMAPAAVYQPSPRDQLLNAAVRHQLEFTDDLFTYNDFQLPRYIEGYTRAAERWASREASSMRHSPAFAGLMLYDEMYDVGLIGVPDMHTTLFPRLRTRVAEEHFGEPPAQIRTRMGRELRRPPAQRDPQVLARYAELRAWEEHGWGEFNGRVARAARRVAPQARIGTYYTSFLYVTTGLGSVVSGTDMDNGYHPDVFADLDVVASVHYTDNGGGWVHSPMLVPLLRFGPRRPVYVSIPMILEVRSHYDGEYQRQMAFGMLSEGADGVSEFGLPHSFLDGPNPDLMTGKETTGQFNRQVLAPFGELATVTEPGYRKVGIVLTENQLIFSEFKPIRTANQAEELWLACWRLGYPAVFLREDALAQPLDGLDVIFVPGIRFPGELAPEALKRLEEAARRGAKVVVEKGSTLELGGLTRLDFTLDNYFLGATYAPAFQDDELERVYRYSQPATDFLADKLPQWTQPSARGPFRVGPNWRRGGAIHYLVMGNFEDPDYSHTLKQITAKPTLLPLTVAATRGRVAYDLLRSQPVPLTTEKGESRFTLDLTRAEGALLAFLPEDVGQLSIKAELATDGATARVSAGLAGVSGQALDGLFPARVTLSAEGVAPRVFYRVLGGDRSLVLTLPGRAQPTTWRVEVREAITGRAASVELARPALAGPALQAAPTDKAVVPYPEEVKQFLTANREVLLLTGTGLTGIDEVAKELVGALEQRGMKVTRQEERAAWRFVAGDPAQGDPMNDGYHSWRSGFEVIQPGTIVEQPVILLGGQGSSYLLHQLAVNGFLSVPPSGGPGQAVQPTVQVATRGLSAKHDALCLIANDAAGLRQAMTSVLAATPPPAPPAAPAFGPAKTAASQAVVAAPPALAALGTNEMVDQLEFDPAGNLYLTTWGHGDNLYSLGPDGQFRFSRYLPEMGAWALGVYPDRLVAYTVAGARLYQLGLDGKPLTQVRLPLDVGWRSSTSGYPIYYTIFRYVPQSRCVVHREDMTGRMQVLNEQGALAARWEGDEYTDPADTAAKRRRGLHDFAISPDGTRLAQIESTQYQTEKSRALDSYLVLRDLKGTKLAEYPSALVNDYGQSSVSLFWPGSAPGPSALVRGEVLAFDAQLKLLGRKPWRGGLFDFGERGLLVTDGHALRFLDRNDRELARFGPFPVMPSFAVLSPDGKLVCFLDEYGQASLRDAATGAVRSEFTVPELGRVVRFAPDGQHVYIGGLRGAVLCYDLAGKLAWQTELGPHNAHLPQPLARYDASYRDTTNQLWPTIGDQPGQLEQLVRFDADRLVNGNAEAATGWVGEGPVAYGAGRTGKRSLEVGAATVSQEVRGLIGNHFTWVLEFWYKQAGKEAGQLTAGLRTEAKYPAAAARHFTAGNDWQFARLVTKNGQDAQALAVGFRATAATLVDDVSLRRVRFPSVNHLLYEPLHEVTPLVLTKPLLVEHYDPLGNLREQTPNRIIVESNVSGGLNLVEPGFLQNGRLNDVGSDWYIKPLQDNDVEIAIGLREPRWVSMVGLYFNVYDEANVTPHFDLYVSDVDTKKTHLVASVRHNRQLFALVKFPPHKADQLTLKLVNVIPRLQTLTEIEVYGPLSGKEGQAGFADAAGQNTYMGDFTRVEKRRLALSERFYPPQPAGQAKAVQVWSFVCAQPLLAEGQLYLARTLGHNQRWDLGGDEKTTAVGRSGALGYGPYNALYGGVLLKPGTDGKLYCIDPASSRELWSVVLGSRLRGCPVAIAEDVYLASDTGKLYALDIASGTILRQADLSGAVTGSLATDNASLYFLSADGLLQCWQAGALSQRWKAPIAPWSDGTPAVDKGVVYCADQAGAVRAVDAANGTVRWTTELGQEVTGCPVVTAQEVIVGCRGGKLATLDRASGRLLWQKQTASRFADEPLAVELERFTPAQWQPVHETDFRKVKTLPPGFEPVFCANPATPQRKPAADPAVAKADRNELALAGKSGEATGLGMLRWQQPFGEDARIEVIVSRLGNLVIAVGGDALDGYRAVLDFTSGQVTFDTLAGGTARTLAQAPRPLPLNAGEYTVALEKQGGKLRLTVNGATWLRHEEAKPAQGGPYRTVAIGTTAPEARLRLLKVERLGAAENTTAERAILYFDGLTAKVANPATGADREWQVQFWQNNKAETKTVVLTDTPLAPLAWYQGELDVVLRQLNSGHKELAYNGTYFQWTAGGVFRLAPVPRD